MHASRPEVIELRDPEAERLWSRYRASGLPDLVSAYGLCHALFAFAKSGMAGRITPEGHASTVTLLDGVDPHLGRHLLHYLEVQGVLEAKADGYRLSERGQGLLLDISLAQLGAYREAYGPVFDEMPALLCGQKRYGVDVVRDGAALGGHSAVLFHTFHTPIILRGIREIGASYLLDLGCGAGRALIDACRRDPEFRGIGLDISEDAIAYARKLAAEEGVADRLDFVVGDAFRPDTWPSLCQRADALLAVGVMHEHFRAGEAAVIDLLDCFADGLHSRYKGFLLGEPELRYDRADNDPDFYLAHIFTNQGFPRDCQGWLELFPKSRLRCRKVLRRRGHGPRLVFYDLVAAD